MEEVKEKGVETTRTEGVNATPTRCSNHHNVAWGSGELVVKNLRQYSSTEQTGSTLPPSQLLPIIQPLQGFEWPRPKSGDPKGRDKSRYCEYHKDVGHRSNDCYRLWRLLNFMVKRGHLQE